MQLCRCPACHARISLDAVVQDEAGRELLGLLAKLDTVAGTALVGYLGLFRSPTRDLSNAKALKLARDVLAMEAIDRVAIAMQMTVDAIQAKPSPKALSNHNYLLKVLADVAVPQATALPTVQGRAPQSKTAQALMALESMKNAR